MARTFVSATTLSKRIKKMIGKILVIAVDDDIAVYMSLRFVGWTRRFRHHHRHPILFLLSQQASNPNADDMRLEVEYVGKVSKEISNQIAEGLRIQRRPLSMPLGEESGVDKFMEINIEFPTVSLHQISPPSTNGHIKQQMTTLDNKTNEAKNRTLSVFTPQSSTVESTICWRLGRMGGWQRHCIK